MADQCPPAMELKIGGVLFAEYGRGFSFGSDGFPGCLVVKGDGLDFALQGGVGGEKLLHDPAIIPLGGIPRQKSEGGAGLVENGLPGKAALLQIDDGEGENKIEGEGGKHYGGSQPLLAQVNFFKPRDEFRHVCAPLCLSPMLPA